MSKPSTYRPLDYIDGPVGHLTIDTIKRLVRLAERVARNAADPNVVEEARRIADELRARKRDQYRARQAPAQARRRREPDGRFEQRPERKTA